MCNARTRRQRLASGKTRRVLGLGVFCLGAAAIGPQISGPAAADETVMIQVRGHSQLRLYEGERRTTDGESFQLVVHVQLDDGQQHAGSAAASPTPEDPATGAVDPAHVFARKYVKLRIRGADGELATPTVITDEDGHARFPLSELPGGSYSVSAEYAGDALRDPARAELTVDLGRSAVSLGLEVPTQVTRTGQLPVEVRLQSEGQGLSAMVMLDVGGKPVAVPVLQGVGRVTLPLREQARLRKGQVLSVIASYRGDRLHTSALQRRDVLLTSQAHITLELAARGHESAHRGVVEIAQGSTLIAVGVVSDDEGPLPGEAVDLEVTEQPGGDRAEGTLPSEPPPRTGRASASGVSDSQGHFRIVIPRLPLRPGPAVLAAEVQPHARFILPARAAELPLTVLPPEPVSALYYVLPLLASVLGALLWLLGRWLQPQLRRLRELVRQRRVVPEPVVTTASTSSVDALAVGAPGVSLAPSRRLTGLTLRRTIDTTLDGQVVDASFGRPVAAAVLELAPATAASTTSSERTLHTTADGRFIAHQLPPGHYLIVVTAPGYLPQRFPAAIPHRGELRGISVRLEPIRVRLLEEWRRVAQRLLGQESRLRTATPRELLEQFGRLRATALTSGTTTRELRRLTELVEQAYYSPRVCTPEMLAEATRLADAVLTSGVTPSVPPPGAPTKAPGSPVPLS